MAFGTLTLSPGVDTQHTPATVRHGWAVCNLIRFRDGFPEKLGGWAHLNSTLLTGTALGMHAWADLNGIGYLIAGTEQRVQVYNGGSLYDVTPTRVVDNPTPAFSTATGNAAVTVKVKNHGASPGDWLYLATQISVGGIVLYRYYQIAAFIDRDHFTINAASPALFPATDAGSTAQFSTTTNSATVTVVLDNHGLATGGQFNIEVPTLVGDLSLSGNVTVTVLDANTFTFVWGALASFNDTEFENQGNAQFQFLISSGLATNQLIGGYGAGTYGSGIYGVPNTATFPAKLRQWFWDNWGQDGIGNPTGGTLYLWTPLTSGAQRATPVTNAPAQIMSSFVAMPQRIAVALGSTVAGVFDPSLASWSDAQDYTDWTASVSNQAGSYRIPTGSKIVGGLQAPLQALVWTDIDLYVMQYVGLPFVFGFNKIADECGLLSARAAGEIGGLVAWAGPQGFFVYENGSVQPLECPVWRTMYRNINMGQLEQVFCAVNVSYNEIAWFYPSGSSTVVDSYVKWNILENVWDYGSLGRSAWVGQSVLGTPIGADYAGLLQQHEVGYSADGALMSSMIETGLQDISNGHDFIFMDQIIPDWVTTAIGSLPSLPQMSLTGYKTPQDQSPVSYGPYGATGVGYISTRFRGRLAQFTITDNSSGFWRMGLIRYRYAPDGSR